MMFDTTVTIVGNALNTPEWRRFGDGQALVARFRLAATSRRLDRETGRWVDGASLRVRVNCWRRLGENVAASVLVGDPLVVTGRLYTRDWTTDDGQRRSSFELDATAVGHDLARGRSAFTRSRPSAAASDPGSADDHPPAAAEQPAEGPAESWLDGLIEPSGFGDLAAAEPESQDEDDSDDELVDATADAAAEPEREPIPDSGEIQPEPTSRSRRIKSRIPVPV